jgi:hypothetical protein
MLTRPVGRHSNTPVVWYAGFLYQAKSWNQPRRVVAKVEWHSGELFPRVGFIVTNLTRPAKRVVRFYNQRGTAEQWIKEGKNAVKWTRLSCHDFVDNQVRLHLFVLAYLRNRQLFDQITPRKKVLPCLLSIHPKTAGIVSKMRRDARLGEQTDDARRVGSKTWFVSDTPANIYARAIINSIRSNSDLSPVAAQQSCWGDFDREGKVRTIVRPFPKFVDGLEKIPIPMAPDNVLQYWRKGKEIILEDMPDFHLRPEWQKYQKGRNYREGAKKGAIQHAIFKDILIALKTIAGANKKRAGKKSGPR